MNKRIIICGPTAAGKSALKNRFVKKGFIQNISYTTRKKRDDEENGVDYVFISKIKFKEFICNDVFREYTSHAGELYGTTQLSWKNSDIFVMEVEGIKNMTPEERDNSFIIYLTPPFNERYKRLKEERKWDDDKIERRINDDESKFRDFNIYDMNINNPKF